MSTHPLSPLPQRLAKLLIRSEDKGLAQKVERYFAKNSDGIYDSIHCWLDDTENHELRHTLGTKVCELIEAGNFSALED